MDEPGDAVIFAGTTLTHTDWMPDNVLISHGRAWLVDWAWATPGAGWIDPAFWLLRLVAHGHTIEQPEAHAGRMPEYAAADPAHLDVFARANVNMWSKIAGANPIPWAKTMAQAARAWAQHRSARILIARSHRAGSRPRHLTWPTPGADHAERCSRLRALAALSRADRRFAALWMSTARS